MDANFTSLMVVPDVWVQTLRAEGGALFRVKGILGHTTNLIISDAGAAKGLPIEVGFYRGIQDWKIPDVPKESPGFISYSPQDQYSDRAFLTARCSMTEVTYDDAWHCVRQRGYDTCEISAEVTPVTLGEW